MSCRSNSCYLHYSLCGDKTTKYAFLGSRRCFCAITHTLQSLRCRNDPPKFIAQNSVPNKAHEIKRSLGAQEIAEFLPRFLIASPATLALREDF